MHCQVNVISSEGGSTCKIQGSSDQREKDLYAAQGGGESVFNQQLEVQRQRGIARMHWCKAM